MRRTFSTLRPLGNFVSLIIRRLAEIEPNKPLHHHWSFWCPIVIFGSLSCYVGFMTNSFALEYLTQPTTTMDALAYPLFVFSFALPIVLAVGRFHASAQRAETIRISESTMSFKHYFDHREAFKNYMEGYKQKYSGVIVSIQSPIALYEVFYPSASMERFDIKPSSKTAVLIEEALSYAADKLKSLQDWSVAGCFIGDITYFDKLGIKIQFDVDATASRIKSYNAMGRIYLTSPFLDEVKLILEYANSFDRGYDRLCKNSCESIEKYIEDKEQYRQINDVLTQRMLEISTDQENQRKHIYQYAPPD